MYENPATHPVPRKVRKTYAMVLGLGYYCNTYPLYDMKKIHTVGPWQLHTLDLCSIQDSEGTQVAKATYVPTSTQLNKTKINGAYYIGNGTTAMANAKLIAAAPELLDVLIDLYMSEYGGNSVDLQDAMRRASTTDAFEQKIIAAIKKATE